MSLNKTSVGMAQIVGQSLATKGIELYPVQNTPVQVLTDLSSDALALNEGAKMLEGGFERPDMCSLLLEGADASTVPEHMSQHSVQLSESVRMLSSVLHRTLDLTQNVVNPMIDRVSKAVTAHIEQKLQATASPLEIVQQRQDPIFDSIYLQESTQRYVNQIRDVPLRSLKIQMQDLGERLYTGHPGMDAQLKEFVDRTGVEFAQSVWSNLFYETPINSMQVFARLSDVKAAVYTYFFAAKALQNAPAGANIELSEWRAYCSALLAAAGATIQASYRDRELSRSSSRIVLSYPMMETPTGQIVVDGDKYTNWLAQGGTPELIFATAYGDRNFDAVRMLERKERLLADWSKIMALYQTEISYKRFDALVEGLRQAVTTEINTYAFGENEDRSVYHERLRTMAHRTKQRDLDDLWHLCRKVVCQTLFPHTEAEVLLLGIDEQSKLHPEKDVRELALYATIDIVAKWLCSQLVVKAHLPF
jgi:hypothetical protein